jgi:ABC-2 type transport system ATP-binding protein
MRAAAPSVPAAPAAPLRLSVRGLTKKYGASTALDQVTFTVEPGEIFGLLGPNGAGKTSCLECILGLRAADAGAILIDGRDVSNNRAHARSQVGAVLQSSELQDAITVREALQLYRSFHPSPAPLASLLEEFGLGQKSGSRFSTLSGGERQRLFLALAFVAQPRLVVLDEPSVGLDPLSRRVLHRSILQARERGCTLLLSTHYLDEADQLCDRVAILDQGKIVAVDTPQALRAGTRSPARIQARFTPALASSAAARLPSVTASAQEGETLSLSSSDVAATLSSLISLAQSSGASLQELQVRQPSLEDVFLELTGRVYPQRNDTPVSP